MCTMVYLGSHRPLSTIAWCEDHPAFYVESLPPESRDNSVRQHLSGPFVYRLGSHQYCGCGFQYRYDPEWPDAAVYPDELDAAENSRASLAEYLTDALKNQETLEIWLCWAGDEANDPEARIHVLPSDFLNPKLFEEEKVLLTVTNTPE